MLAYLALAFGIAWLCQIPVYSSAIEGAPAIALLAIGGAAPSLAAVIVTRGAVWRETWRRAPLHMLLVAFAGPSLFMLIAGGITGELSFGAPNLGALIWPPLGEELGWRGYLQPKLRERFSLRATSLAAGAIWALWHLPTSIGSWSDYPAYALSIIVAGVFAGWLWEKSGRSTLVAIAFHAGINLGVVHAPNIGATIAWVALALLLIARRA